MKVEYPCYELHSIPVDVTNPFSEGGTFKIILVEVKSESNQGNESALLQTKKKKPKKVRYVNVMFTSIRGYSKCLILLLVKCL